MIEILLGIGLLMVTLSFAVPSLSNAAARAELHAASENMEYSIRSARHLARLTETPVSMNVGSTETPAVISFTYRVKSPVRDAAAGLQPFTLPSEIRIDSTANNYVFDNRGLAENPGVITLIHRSDKALNTDISVE
ncbi:MAG: hypothetical protein RQ826_10920 [Xanthomonadales bacterium]|nr:hypothetical protein [Xanthomonadales bacterium]